nr:hypothetical protein [uncultured Rhodopila sp.]
MTAITRSTLLAGVLLGLPVGCGGSQTSAGGPVPTAATPGWTGRTVVTGSTSTVGGNATATEQQQKWQLGPSR